QAPPPELKVIKCDNCGVENPSSNSVCSNCGSPLPRLAPAGAPVNIPPARRGMPVAAPLAAKKKPNWLVIGGIIAALAVCCIAAAALFLPSKSVEATVVDVRWQTSVPVQEIRAVSHSDEDGKPPSDCYHAY